MTHRRSFLFVVPPLVGHTAPTVAVAAELVARGHRVAWAGHPEVCAPLLPRGAELHAAPDRSAGPDPARTRDRAAGLRGLAALKFFWEEFQAPLTEAMIPAVESAVSRAEPDLLVVDQQAPAGAVVAQRRGLPWVTSATTSAECVDGTAVVPGLGDWVARRAAALPGWDPGWGDPRFSPRLVLLFTGRTLAGPDRDFPPHYAFVGPCLPPTRPAADFPWAWLTADPGARLVLVSLGTVTRADGERFLRTAVDAFAEAGHGVRLIVVAPDGLLTAPGPHVLLRPAVPQLALLPRLDAVVSHGGHNTVCETLAHGLPLVLAPIRDDQPVIAEQVVRTGAGIRVPYARVRAADLRAAVRTVLDVPAHRAAAAAVRADLLAAGGAPAAADRLEAALVSA
jgi:UDP:flavonoid glycosyltransferase YjiC (YdhE family)